MVNPTEYKMDCLLMTLQALDPEIVPTLEARPPGSVNADNLATFRVQPPAPELSEAVVRKDYVVPGSPGVPVRVYRPAGATGALPCIYYIHGGGYVMGSCNADDPKVALWCRTLGIAGISVDYRLAPETPYPGPLEDCFRGLKWVYDNADELGVDRKCLGIAGISAGGGLAASLAILNRDRGEMPIAFQLLHCPMLDDRQQTPSSQLDGLAAWSRESNAFGWRSYLGDLYGTDHVPCTAAPSRCEDLSGLPPAFISVGTVDGFRDEDVAYATRLNQAGVPCELHVYPGGAHGYHLAVHSTLARRSHNDILDWLARQISR